MLGRAAIVDRVDGLFQGEGALLKYLKARGARP